MKILLVGGGSAGPVAPMLAVAQYIQKDYPKARFLLVGTKYGPEGQMAKALKIDFIFITAGKLRRYFSIKNLISPVQVAIGFFQSLKILKKFKPDCISGTGSFVQVPLVWAAWVMGIPVVLHQQDVAPSLANKLCQLAASKITVSFEIHLKNFASSLGIFYKSSANKVELTGNPVREDLVEGNKEQAIQTFNLNKDFPTLLVLGGGTGAQFINNLIVNSLPQLTKVVQVIHSTGRGKFNLQAAENYHAYEFINNMAEAYAAADIVLARAGMSTITELSYLKKVAIIIPMPNTHQEYNAELLRLLGAAFRIKQSGINSEGLVYLIRQILFDLKLQQDLAKNIRSIMPHNAAEKISKIILNFSKA